MEGLLVLDKVEVWLEMLGVFDVLKSVKLIL